jgi:hypothetical protein
MWHNTTYRLENTLNYGMERVWAVGYQKGSNSIGIGYDEGAGGLGWSGGWCGGCGVCGACWACWAVGCQKGCRRVGTGCDEGARRVLGAGGAVGWWRAGRVWAVGCQKGCWGWCVVMSVCRLVVALAVP